ncbi:MAG TPA: SRPBCC domain-containing protein, partial [Bacteroidia bacterium]|nr:SRPBCC domain-containing protein [Bacteroidia bacterium]
MKSNITNTISVHLHASIGQVWDALTKPALIKQYLFGTDTKTDWKEGSPIIFEGEWQGKTYQDKGTIFEFKPKQKIRYSYWSSMSGVEDKPENYLIITYALTGKDNDV